MGGGVLLGEMENTVCIEIVSAPEENVIHLIPRFARGLVAIIFMCMEYWNDCTVLF